MHADRDLPWFHCDPFQDGRLQMKAESRLKENFHG
jgi:hypothetical protein